MRKWNHPMRIFFIFIVIFLPLVLSACTNKEQQKPKIPAKNDKPKSQLPADSGREWKVPISITEGEFYKVGGWLSDTEVLYVTNQDQTSSVYRYNLLSGKSALIFKSEHPIVNVQISPAKKYILIHSSPSSYEGVVTVIDTKGSEKLKQSFPSYNLVFEWNPYKETEIMISKFEEDWSFQMFLLDLTSARATELSLPQPFIKWVDVKNVAFLNWDHDNPALFAPLKIKGLENGIEQTVFPKVLHFSAFRDLRMTVTVHDTDQSKAIYSFFNQNMKKVFSFSIPQLTKFSDWLVPFYDYNEKKGEFASFAPKQSGEFDSYFEGFQLLSYNLKKGSSKLIMDGLENEPIAFSPSGDLLLYGNSLEKLIDIHDQKVYELIKE